MTTVRRRWGDQTIVLWPGAAGLSTRGVGSPAPPSADDFLQGGIDGGVPEGVAELLGALRQDTLARQDDLGRLADQQAQGEARHRQERGPVQGAAEGAAEVAVGDRVRGGAVERPL